MNLDHLTREQLYAVIRALAHEMALEMAGSDEHEQTLTDAYIADAVRLAT